LQTLSRGKEAVLRIPSFILAVIAAISTAVIPVAPSYAAASSSDRAPTATLMAQANQGNIAVLSQEQMSDLYRTRPQLHTKLMDAYYGGKQPTLTVEEKRLLQTITARNMKEFKAGHPVVAAGIWAAVAWYVFAFLGLTIALIIFQPFLCAWFGGIFCSPARGS
jgi:hypothetical protein